MINLNLKYSSWVLLYTLITGSLYSCNNGYQGNSALLANNMSINDRLQLSTHQNITSSAGNTYYDSFSTTSNFIMTSWVINFYTSSNCSGSTSFSKTLNGPATITSAHGTYTNYSLANYNLCQLYPGGCSSEFTQTNSFQNIFYTNIGIVKSNCIVGKLGNFDTNSACTSASPCGFSFQPANAQINPDLGYFAGVKVNFGIGNPAGWNPGNYGTKGVSSPSNIPGGLNVATTWVDSSGNLWMFGGAGVTNNTTFGDTNSLWRYNTSNNQWTWVSGSNLVNQDGNYGTKGVEAPTNMPGGREGAGGWIDKAGNLWFFGGYSHIASNNTGLRNGVWRYRPTTNQWTWISGTSLMNQIGTYGTKDVPNVNNIPGGRAFFSSWTDSSGNFWIFGGYGRGNTNTVGILNDLWKYNPNTNEWTWVAGPNTVNQPGVYGTKGVPSSSNLPDSRLLSGAWTDSSGNLWLFGGYDTLSLVDEYNDLWKYNPNTNEWTWVSGSNTMNAPANYGTLGVANSNNIPGSHGAVGAWADTSGNFWIATGSKDNGSFLNDLWQYNPTTGLWTWMGGLSTASSTPNGNFTGNNGTPSTETYFAARDAAQFWFVPSTKKIWMFGGNIIGSPANGGTLYNDMWTIQQRDF